MIDITSQVMNSYSSRPLSLPQTEGIKDQDKLREVCIDFEAIFVKQMLDGMKKTINKSGFIDGGFAEEIYEDMLYDEYAKEIAKTGNLGIADMLYRQLSPGQKNPAAE